MATGGGIFDPIEESALSLGNRLRELRRQFAETALAMRSLSTTVEEEAQNIQESTSGISGGTDSVTSALNLRSGRTPV